MVFAFGLRGLSTLFAPSTKIRRLVVLANNKVKTVFTEADRKKTSSTRQETADGISVHFWRWLAPSLVSSGKLTWESYSRGFRQLLLVNRSRRFEKRVQYTDLDSRRRD